MLWIVLTLLNHDFEIVWFEPGSIQKFNFNEKFTAVSCSKQISTLCERNTEFESEKKDVILESLNMS